MKNVDNKSEKLSLGAFKGILQSRLASLQVAGPLLACLCLPVLVSLGRSSFLVVFSFLAVAGMITSGSDRLSGRCRACHGLIVYSDDEGKTWRHFDGKLHKGHPVNFIEDASVASDLPKKRREHSDEPSQVPVVESPQEGELKEAALSLAKDPALLYRIKLTLDKPIFREDPNKLLLFLICASSLTKRPLAAGITSESAAGKSTLLHGVIKYFPNVDYFTRMTGASLDRLAKDLTGRILVVEELRGADAAQGTIRVAISEGRLRLLTTERDDRGKIITREIETKGTPVFLTTTTSTAIDWETQTRLNWLSCDESFDQTKGVMEFEASEYDDVKPKQETDPVVSRFLGTLQPYDVLIPFARQLVTYFPAKRLSARRDFRKLLNLIALVVFVHQHQRLLVRKRDQPIERRLVATPIDLQYALEIAGQSLRQNIAGAPSRVLSLLQYFTEGEAQTTRSIAHLAKISQRTARRWLGEDLVQAGYLTVDETQKEHLYLLAESTNGENSVLPLEVPAEILHWDSAEVKAWFVSQGFQIVREASDPTYVSPFTGSLDLPEAFHRPLAECQSKLETAVLHGQTAEIAARPQETAISSRNPDAANGQLGEETAPRSSPIDLTEAITKLQGMRSAPTFEHYVDYAASILKDQEKGKSLAQRLRRDGQLLQDPTGHWTWARESGCNEQRAPNGGRD